MYSTMFNVQYLLTLQSFLDVYFSDEWLKGLLLVLLGTKPIFNNNLDICLNKY